MSALDAQVGAVEEATYGTAVTVTKFDEFVSESVTATYGRIESNGLRPSRLYRSDARFTTYVEGASGDLELEVASKGFGFWLRQMLGGTPVTTGAGPNYTHTFTPGDTRGRSFTLQVGRPLYDGSSVQAFTYAGGKVTGWELANDNESNLTATLACDFQSESTAIALATASYPTGVETFSWVGGTVTIAGVAFDVMNASVTGENSLNVERRYLRASALKKEQLGDDYRGGGFSLTADFDSLTQQARVASATAAGALAAVVLKWEAQSVIPTTAVKPSLTVTLNGRFDEFAANVGGPQSVTQEITGTYLGATALSAVYVTADATTIV